MANITIYIVNLGGVSDDIMNNASTILSGYFNTVVWSTDSTISAVSVVSSSAGVSPQTTDLLCYVLPSHARSKVMRFNPAADYKAGQAGLTSSTDSAPWRAASEVYVDIISNTDTNQALAYANLIFHELMHNKGTIGDDLHNTAGYGLAAETVDSTSTLTDGNCTFLRGILDKEVKQYV